MNKTEFQMPYKYFRDENTKILERSQPEMADPDFCFKALLNPMPDGISYLLNRKNRALAKRDGPFKPPYYSVDLIEDIYHGQDAFVLCPGPSMNSIDHADLENKLTIAVNSAGFKINATLWAMFESNYLHWFINQKIPHGRTYIMTARCAIRWRGWGHTSKSKAVFVPRFEEMKIMPHRTPAVGTMGALVTAWWLGAKRIFLIGMDLSRPQGKPYTSGIPYSSFGAKHPFAEQILAMRQFSLPDVEIYNGSPHSSKEITNIPYKDYNEIAAIVKESSCVPDLLTSLSPAQKI